MRTGKVTTATPLSQEEVQRLEERLSSQLGMAIKLENQVDKNVFGGIKIRLGDDVLDATLSGQLGSLRAIALNEFDPFQRSSASELFADAQNQRNAHLPTVSDLGSFSHENIHGYFVPGVRKSGQVLSVGDGIAHVEGLEDCRMGELLLYGDSQYAIALNLEEKAVGAVLLSRDQPQAGDEMVSTGKVVQVPTGDALLGRVVNPLGQPLDEQGPIQTNTYRPIEAPAANIMQRKPVDRPLMTGLLAIDAMVPVGKGQRELIIGDRKTGKTAIAIDTILNQKGKNVLCIYVAIGQKASTVAAIEQELVQYDAMKYTVLVVSTASDGAPMQYIAPYAGCAMGEEWMYQGRDVLMVYDDLSKHAVAYRTMSLLLKRPPGREAYPGDVFYLHSRLLERAAQLSDDLGGGSMTALPIIETQAGDISAYIPTNVISITDGQLFLESELFNSGVRPAVNVGLSVSRVGGAAQSPAMRKVASRLRLTLSQYRELKVFSQFGSDLDESTRQQLAQGERLTELCKQAKAHPLPMAGQVVLLYALMKNLYAGSSLEIREFKQNILPFIEEKYPQILQNIEHTGQLSQEIAEQIEQAVSDYQMMKVGV